MLGTFGLMLGTGGSAIVAKTMGEGDQEKANRLFTMFVIIAVAISVVFIILGEIFLPQIATLLQAEGETYEHCVIYGRIVLGFLIFLMLQFVFQSFMVVAEKTTLGLILTVVSGVTNMILDAVFIVGFKMGVAGAAIATGVSQVFAGLFPIIYFLCKNNSKLRFAKPLWSFKYFIKASANGSSEFLSNIAASVVTMLCNYQLMRLVGDDGVAAYGAIMYVAMIFMAIFMGYSIGSSPIVSYNYGAKNTAELKNLFRKSLVLMAIFGVIMTALSEALAAPLSKLFVGYEQDLYNMTVRGLRLYAICFVLSGFNIFTSGFFTALNNWIVSAIISSLRTLVFQVAAILVLPIFLQLDGVWISVVVAEVLSLIVSIVFLCVYRKRYEYI